MPAPWNVERGLYADYRAEIEGDSLVRSLRTAVFVLFVIQSVFIFVDWLLFPENFAAFLSVRLGLNAVLAWIYFRTTRSHPLPSTIATCFAGGGMLLTVVQGTGGAASPYYVGLVLLFLGIGVLVPLSGRQAGGIISVLLGVYAALPFFGGDAIPWESFALHCFFLFAAAFEGVMSCALLDQARFSDFKQRRELEAARDSLRELDRAKSRFTANVHHELRTPLTLMLAPLEAMLAGEFGDVPDRQRGYMETMRANALRLLKLINNLLDFSKIESREYRLTRKRVNVGRMVGGVVAGARPLAEKKGIRIATSGLQELPEIYADVDAVEKVMLNLLGNALKFTDRGGFIEVAAEAERDGIHFRVSDDGAGIPPDQLDRIFDRFAQADATATRRHEGTGIGLALTRELVELHGGWIWAESEGLDRGACFHVVLPRGKPDVDEDERSLRALDPSGTSFDQWCGAVDAELEGAEVDAPEPEQAGGQGDVGPAEPERRAPADAPAVLVVEDNAEMRRFLAQLLRREFRVRTAANGREGLLATRASRPDLVLTDLMMPEMTGTDLCRALKQDPQTRDVPVVLLTAKAEREMKVEGLELGAIDYVTKPFHPRELMARVRSIANLHQLREELARRNAVLERTMAELKETEVQLVQAERLAAVGELAAGIAHEVNNPVNFAVNSLHALRARVDDLRRLVTVIAALDPAEPERLDDQLAALEREKQALGFEELAAELEELTGIVTEGLERTHRLVADLRDFAGPGRGPRTSVDVRDGLGSTLRLMRHATQVAGVRVETNFAVDLPRVQANPGGLNQVFLNLLKNSTEALEGTGGTIQVVARAEPAAVVVEVRDDGPGIAPEVRDRLFEPFVSTKGAGRGTGLGLSVSRRVIQELGGSIEVLSGETGGATFRVRLPIGGSDAA